MRAMNGTHIYETTHVAEGAPVIRTDLIRAACAKWLVAHGVSREDFPFNSPATAGVRRRKRRRK